MADISKVAIGEETYDIKDETARRVATASAVGLVKPDGASISIDTDGTIHAIGGGSGVAIGDVQGASITIDKTTASIKWTDPEDIVVSGVTLAAWGGTLLVRKIGSAPTSRLDGTVIIDSKTRNAYSATALTDTGLEYGTTYYYRFFPYNTTEAYTNGSSVNTTPTREQVAVPTVGAALTFNGAEQTQGFNGYDSTKMSVTGETGMDAGDYTATFSVLYDCEWTDGTRTDKDVAWTIAKQQITPPSVTSDLVYDTTEQSAMVGAYDNTKVSVTGITGTNAGAYTATLHLLDSNNYEWNDGTTADKTTDWEIEKADGDATLSKNSVTITADKTSDTVSVSGATGAVSVSSSDKNLATASLSGSTITVTAVGETSGSVTVTVNIAEADNYKAAVRTISVALQFSRTMTVILNLSDSNPETWATYADDAVGMTAGSSEWDEFFGHYPTLLKNGVENGRLDPSNRNVLADGGAADVTSGSAGDVMIAFPRHGLKITNDGSEIAISMTDAEDDSNFDYYAHTYKGQRCDKFYLGACKGVVKDSKLRSLSGKTVTANQTIGAFRTNAQANGDGYEQSGFFQLTYRQAMYLLKYKGQNAQIAVGRGYVDGNNNYATTGNTFTQAMDYGEATGKVQCSLFGLEDFWGNYWEFIDGVYCNASRKITVADGNFNDTGSGYIDSGAPATSADGGGYMNKANGTSLAGFTIAEGGKSGSETTYFCDGASAYASRLAFFGGSRANGSNAGVFPLYVNRSASASAANVAARLMFMHVAE